MALTRIPLQLPRIWIHRIRPRTSALISRRFRSGHFVAALRKSEAASTAEARTSLPGV